MGYFKPLRRKLGVLTLIMACGFAVGWIKSMNAIDIVEYFPDEFSMVRLVSWDGNVCCSHLTEKGATFNKGPQIHWFSNVIASFQDEYPFETEFEGCQWIWRFGHLGIASWFLPQSDCIAAVMPYWTIVVPLTTLSAYLLLSKPRKSNPKKDDESITAEGT